MDNLRRLEEGDALRERPMVQKVQLSRMLDEGKTPIEVDYSNKYVSLKDLMQTSSDHVRTTA